MDMLLAGDDARLAILRRQFEQARVSSRRLTGVGFFTSFESDPTIPSLGPEVSIRLSDVRGRVDGLRHGAGFVLFVDQGMIGSLEGFSFDEPWPERMGECQLSYDEGERRSAERLREMLGP